ncbi:MAG: TIM-barrel domain-containing protein [Chitinophagaceae bacterium]
MRSTRFYIILAAMHVCTMASYARKESTNYTKLDDGITIRLNHNGTRLIKIEPVTDKIIHVTASPSESFSTAKSLMLDEKIRQPVQWRVEETADAVMVYTAAISAKVLLTTGEISFSDKNGRPLLQEPKGGGKIYTAVNVDGDQTFALRQAFETTDEEAFYGLGQHQEGAMNYKNSQVSLVNYNTGVAIPFLVSNKNYGILWDNYSITKVMDSRSFEPLSTMKLFSATGEQGWLTATYFSKADPSKLLIERPESVIDYSFIPDLVKFPAEIKLEDVTVKWEGSIATGFTGEHSFYMRSSGYTKIWIDGKLMADKWRQGWNPGTVQFKVPMEKDHKYSFRIEWNPDGGQSYIDCNWLPPLQGHDNNEYAFRSEAGPQIDYYFLRGENLDEVIGGYRELTGKATLIPKWALGFWQSRERYKTQEEILNTVAEFRKRKIPLDNIVEDWSYWEQDKWGSQEFDKSRFPDAAGMIKTLHEKYNTQFMISVWPKFYETTDNFKFLDKNGWMYKGNIANQNRDWIGKGYISSFYDAFNPKAREALWNMMNKSLYSKGVDAWWMDATEPDIHSNLNVAQRKQLMGPTAIGSSTQFFNAYPLQHSKGVYEGQRNTNPDKRVFILTRSAYAGMQRYAAATWSGDIGSRWEDFKNQVPAGINFSMSGMPWWTSDIGGFSVEKRFEKPKAADMEEWQEMQTRWYQFGAFCPLFRVHGQFPFREMYNISGEGEPAYKSMLYYDKMRYYLMPYIYSLAQKTYHENYTIMRGLPMDFGRDAAVKNIGDQYMFGPAFLINPVTDYKARTRSLYLPAGTGWYDFATGSYHAGGQRIVADAPYERMPIFICEGSIVPTGPELQYVAEKPATTITLFVYTGSDGSFKMYEDEGTNYNYEKGSFSTIPFNYNEANKTLTIGERAGSFNGMLQQRNFKIIWVNKNTPKPFDPNAKPDASVNYTGQKLSVKIR